MSDMQNRLDNYYQKRKKQELDPNTGSGSDIQRRLDSYYQKRRSSGSFFSPLAKIEIFNNYFQSTIDSVNKGMSELSTTKYMSPSDIKKVKDKYKKSFEDVSKHRDSIVDEIKRNNYSIGVDTADRAVKALLSYQMPDIDSAFSDFEDYWGQWENEEAYNYSVEKSKKQAEYAALSDDELDAELEKYGKNVIKEIFKGATSNEGKKAKLFSKVTGKADKSEAEDNTLSMLRMEKINRKFKEIDSLEPEIKALIEEYTDLERTKEEEDLSDKVKTLVSALTQTSATYSGDTGMSRREEIAKKLNDSGVENWSELIDYNRLRRDEEYNELIKDEFSLDAAKHPVLTSIATIPASVGKGFGALKTVEDMALGKEVVNYNSPYFNFNDFVNTTRDTVMENHDANGELFGKDIDWFDQIYSSAMSTGDSLFNMALTGGSKMGSIVLGASAMSDTAQEVAQNGGSIEQVLLTGTLAGVNEMLWESVSIGNFKKLGEKGIKNILSTKGIKTLVGNTLKSAGVNASEEFNTEAANLIIDYIVNGGASAYGQAYEAYRSAGYTEDESRSKARQDMVYQTLEAGFGGALQGLFMGGAGSTVGAYNIKQSYKAAAEDYSAEDITALQEKARKLGVDEKYIDVENAGGGPWNNEAVRSNKKTAVLLNKVDAAEEKASKNETVKKAESYGLKTNLFNKNTDSGFEKLSKAVSKIEKEIANKSDALTSSVYASVIKDRLVSLGESESNAQYLARNIIKNYNGESLNDYEAESLKNSNAQKVYREFMAPDSIEWVQAADKQVSSAVYDLHNSYKVKPDTNAVADNAEEKPIVTKRQAVNNISSEVTLPDGEGTVEGFGKVTRDGVSVVVNGTEVALDNVTFKDEKAKAAYEFASQMETTEKAEAALRLYNPHLDRSSDYKSAFDAYYNAGLKGIGTFEGAERYITYGEQFPQFWREDVFKAGREAKSYTPGVNSFYHRKNLSANQKAQLKVLDKIGKKYGISFLVFDSLHDGGELNGVQIRGTNKVAVSLNADGTLYLRTAGHECFHIIEEWNPAAAQELKDKVINYLQQSKEYDYEAQVEKYAERYGVKSYTADGLELIHSEMAADCMFDVFSNEQFITELVSEDKTLAQKVKDFLSKFISDLRSMMKHFTASPELNALREQTETLVDINKSFITALESASAKMQESLKNEQKNNASRTNVTEKADKGFKKSYAGVKAKTHDFSLLEKAIRLDDVGKATSEEIRQQTGWFKGYDGQWRFEIDDSKMEIDTRGKFSSNPDIRRYTELVDKVYFDMTASDPELQELQVLEKNLDGVSVEPKTLGELINHNELFEAYPQLKDLPIYFENDTGAARGMYGFDEIVINSRLKLHKEQLKRTLIHEIQHAIQYIEGFANGASPEYWDSHKRHYTAKENEQVQNLKWKIFNIEREIKKKFGAEAWKNTVQYYDLQESYFKDDVEEAVIEKEIATIENAAIKNGYNELMDEYYYARSDLALIDLKQEQRSQMSNQTLYTNTAGEVEARDVSARVELNKEQRKEIRPDLNRTNVVFADDSVVGNSIVEPFIDKYGNRYDNAVLLDTSEFDNVPTKKWWKVLKQYIEKRITNSTFIMPVIDENGQPQMLEFAKKRDWVSKNGKNPHAALSELYGTNDNISKLSAIHIDEIVIVSEEGVPYYSLPNGHGKFDANGWLHRTANVINIKNGNIHQITMDIAKTEDGRHILYALRGKTKKVGNADVNSLVAKAVSGSELNSNYGNNLTQKNNGVNSNYTQKSADNSQTRKSLKLSSAGEKLVQSSPELQMVFKDLQRQTKLSSGYIPEAKKIHSYAYELKKTCQSTLNVAEIENDLRNIYEVLSSMDDSEGYIYASGLTAELAEKLVTYTKSLDAENAELKELRDRLKTELKGHNWYLSPGMKAEIENRYGSFNNFRKKIWGKGFSFSETSNNHLDSDWSDLCKEFPTLFDESTPDVEQPLVLLAAFEATEFSYGLFGDDYTQQTQYMAAEILNKLTEIPAAETAMDKISNENYKKIAAIEAQNKEKLRALKEEHRKEFEIFKNQTETDYKFKMKRHIESEERAVVLRRVESQIVRLSNMLAKGTKNRHIPLKLIDTVRDLCYAVTLNPAAQRTLGENIGIIEYSYAALNEGKDVTDGTTDNQFMKNAYDEYVHGLISNLQTLLTNKSVSGMSLNELKLVDEVVRAVAQRVSRANELHIESRNEGVEETANSIGGELGAPKVKREFKKDWLNKASDKAEYDSWKFLKPVYAWRMIGSDTFAEIMGNIRKGEDTWAVDMFEARNKMTELAKKYNKNQWSKEKVEIELSSGTFRFSVQQLMMFYVAAQREQYIPHLLGNESKKSQTGRIGGGFVFEDAYKTVESKKDGTKKKPVVYRQRDAGTHTLIESDLEKLAAALTKEQKGYANEARDYLAKDLAVKGNTVTRKLYDINKFTEQNYFPIKVAREFLDGTMKEPEVKSVLSTSIMKDLQEKAANPVLLRDFDVMWAEHVQQMAMFHSFALPLDDFNRVMNFRTTKGKPVSVKDWIETSCGKGAVSYIENFIKDVNGGVRAQSGATLVNSAISKFKKGAVFASASVTIQQPAAIARALAEIDPKYFKNPTLTQKDYDELQKYAPVARVKSMGFFDTSVGQSTVDWLISEEHGKVLDKVKDGDFKGVFENVKALGKDSSYRDEILSKAPEIMDEITWCNIWHAVKNETAAKTKLTGEELLQKSGERFSEVIELTQVYDSVFSKSELMRSKDTGVKMMTAFMAEPTVSLNMLVDATSNIKHGNRKKGVRIIGAVAASVVLTNILKALVTAPRDDDEESTLIEKYIAEVVNGIAGDINPLSLVPIAKDVVSIFQGYEVERTDMSLFQNLYDAVTSLGSSKKTPYRQVEDFAGALAAFLGLPLKNVMRDFRGVWNFFTGLGSVGQTSADGVASAVGSEFDGNIYNKVIKKALFGTSEEQLYNAIKNHNYSAYEKLQKGEYEGDKAKTNAAIRKALRENDERIIQAAEARLNKNSAQYSRLVNSIKADGFSEENIIKAINSVYNELTEANEPEETTEKAYSLYTNEDLMIALETGGDYNAIIDDMIETALENGRTTEAAEKSIKASISKHWKPIYLEASDSEREIIREVLDDTGLYEDIEDTCGDWVLKNLKEQYAAATTPTERASIKSLIWATGKYKSRANMNRALKKYIANKEEEDKE